MKDVVASRLQDDTEHERECLHSQMQELVENYFATNDKSHPSIGTDVVVVDGYEVLDAIAMLVADVSCFVSIVDRHQMAQVSDSRN